MASTESTPLLSQSSLDEETRRFSVRKLVEPVLFLYWLYFACCTPVISQFVHSIIESEYTFTVNTTHESLPCVNRTNNTGYETEDEIQSRSSDWLMYINLAVSIPGIFSTVLVGALSERFGRRILMILPLLGAMVRVLSCLLVAWLKLDKIFLVVGAVVEGTLGMSYTMLMLCFSYLTDITSTKQRSFRVVVLELMVFLGYIVSLLSTGFLIELVGFMWTFVMLLGILVIAFFYVLFILKESREPSAHLQVQCDESEERKSCSVIYSVGKSFKDMIELYIKDDGTKRPIRLRITGFLVLLIGMISLGRLQVKTLYILAFPFCMSPRMIGYYYSVTYAITGIFNVLATKIFGSIVGDLGLVFFGCLFGLAFALFFGFSSDILMLYMAVVVGCGGTLPISLMRSYNSKIVPRDKVESGIWLDTIKTFSMMFVSMSVLETLASLLGGTAHMAVYACTAADMPSLVFIVGAGFYGVGAVTTMCAMLYDKYNTRPELLVATETSDLVKSFREEVS